jgi:hypothetical protein
LPLYKSKEKVTMRCNRSLNLWLLLVVALVVSSVPLMTHRAQAQEPGPGVLVPAVAEGKGSIQATVDATFTYQGHLVKDDSPVSDSCDFQFSLWDSESVGSGSPLGSTQTRTGITVDEGYFTVADLAFGSDAFRGDARYLQIAVRCPAGSGSYTTMGERATLSAVPYAHGLRPGAMIEGAATGTDLGSAVLNVSNSDTGAGSTAIFGVSGSAVTGSYPGTEIGVRGEAAGGIGVAGSSASGTGVNGYSETGTGVSGYSESGYGLSGRSDGDSAVAGVFGSGFLTATGVYGYSENGYGLYASSTGTALYSDGDAHVEGSLTWKAHSSYISVPAAAFHPVDDGYDFYNEGYVLLNEDGISDNYTAALSLPHGATVRSMSFHWLDNSTVEDLSCILYRTNVTASGGGSVATLTSSGDTGTGTSSTTGIDETVDNSQYIYHLALYLPDANTGAYSVVIEYTTTAPH